MEYIKNYQKYIFNNYRLPKKKKIFITIFELHFDKN